MATPATFLIFTTAQHLGVATITLNHNNNFNARQGNSHNVHNSCNKQTNKQTIHLEFQEHMVIYMIVIKALEKN